MQKREYNVIDLFCGCGGLSLGFEQAGYNVLLGVDICEDALATFRYNHKRSKTLCADLSAIEPAEIRNHIGNRHVDIVIGGPPCQGFSVAGKRIIEDKRNELYKSFVFVVQALQPEVFVLENVPNIITMGDGQIKKKLIDDFAKLSYNVVFKVLNASDYGVPQNRKRAVFVGMKHSTFNFTIPTTTHKVTCEEALSDLGEKSIEDGNCYIQEAMSEYQSLMRRNSTLVFNHQTTAHNEKTIRTINLVPDGGNYKNLPQELQHIRNVHIAWTRLNSQRPSITIDTGHRHHFHYKWNRVPTVRECARIQSFPDNFVFLGSKTSQYKQVGNAVPPLMAQAIATQIKNQL